MILQPKVANYLGKVSNPLERETLVALSRVRNPARGAKNRNLILELNEIINMGR